MELYFHSLQHNEPSKSLPRGTLSAGFYLGFESSIPIASNIISMSLIWFNVILSVFASRSISITKKPATSSSLFKRNSPLRIMIISLIDCLSGA